MTFCRPNNLNLARQGSFRLAEPGKSHDINESSDSICSFMTRRMEHLFRIANDHYLPILTSGHTILQAPMSRSASQPRPWC